MRPEDDLVGLRQFLALLEAAATSLTNNGQDIKERESNALKREIAYLESVLARAKRDH
jgi:hypothetical protein